MKLKLWYKNFLLKKILCPLKFKIFKRGCFFNEYCKSCGKDNKDTWFITTDIQWKELIHNEGSVRCINCFIKEMKTIGYDYPFINMKKFGAKNEKI